MKNRKKFTVGRVLFEIVYWTLMLAFGGFAGWNNWLESVVGAIGFFVVLLVLAIGSNAIRRKFWPKQTPTKETGDGTIITEEGHAKKDNPLLLILRTSLQLVMGGAFGLSAVGLIFTAFELPGLWNIWVYLGLLALSIVILLVIIYIPFFQDAEQKIELAKVQKDWEETKKEMPYYIKDERIMGNAHKAASDCFNFMIYPLLIFGAILAEFPPSNFNIVTGGIIVFVVSIYIIYATVLELYNSGKLDASKPERPSIILRTLCFLPPILLCVRWATSGLSSMGIAFLVVFVLASILLVLDYILRRKAEK
ncbi:MAG: hypothetical protein FWB93_02635 [Oscillospiraceae bacterium]|nr:hypothetical protein [Oscillospiraceae bacterium]